MTGPINPSEVAGYVVSDLISSAFARLIEGLAGIARTTTQKIFEDFKPYMAECYRRNKYVRILCQDDEDVDLEQIYVESDFNHGSRKYTGSQLIFEINEGKNHVITGSGGAGKTFFMRKLWLDLFREGNRAPVFVELRNLNELTEPDLITLIRVTISTSLTDETFNHFCETGRFAFILDGFDELPKHYHDNIQKQILKLSETYTKCSVIVSSRPDGRFAGWASFRVCEAAPFSLVQIRKLCTIIPFDAKYRKAFLRVLTKEFYAKYSSFLSNPLLAVMMMMVFRSNMDIASKMGIFYDQAFSTLYQFHDSTKAFKRRKNLDIQQFRRVFGVFCLLSYSKEKFDFSQTELEELVDEARTIVGVNVAVPDILDDLERNVNLIRLDGIRYYFIHRSFQEYFSAWALANIFPHKFRDFAVRIEGRLSDSVIAMSYDLQRSLVVKDYLTPKYEEFSEKYGLDRKLSEAVVWANIIRGVSIRRMDWDVKVSNARRSDISFGYTLKIPVELIHFFSNVSIMSGGNPERPADRIFFKPIFSTEVIDALKNSIGEFGLSEDGDEVRVAVKLDQMQLCVKSERLALEKSFSIEKKDRQIFADAAEQIAKSLNGLMRWIRSEIDYVKVTDETLERLFRV